MRVIRKNLMRFIRKNFEQWMFGALSFGKSPGEEAREAGNMLEITPWFLHD